MKAMANLTQVGSTADERCIANCSTLDGRLSYHPLCSAYLTPNSCRMAKIPAAAAKLMMLRRIEYGERIAPITIPRHCRVSDWHSLQHNFCDDHMDVRANLSTESPARGRAFVTTLPSAIRTAWRQPGRTHHPQMPTASHPAPSCGCRSGRHRQVTAAPTRRRLARCC